MGDLHLRLARLRRAHLPYGVVRLDYRVRLGDVDKAVLPAADPRHILVDLKYDIIRLGYHGLGQPLTAGTAEIPLVVHRRDGQHGDVDREIVLIIRAHVAEVHRDEKRAPLVHQMALIRRAEPAVVYKMLKPRVALDDLYRPGDEVAAYLDIPQLIPALAERRVQRAREAVVGRIVHPVPALHDADRLFCCFQLRAIFIEYRHGVLLLPSFTG